MPMTVVEGWTGDIDLSLKQAGTPTNLTGATVALRLFDKAGDEVSEGGTLATTGAPTDGIVRYSPGALDFLRSRSPMYARVEVVSGGKKTFYPSQNSDVWTVIAVSGHAP